MSERSQPSFTFIGGPYSQSTTNKRSFLVGLNCLNERLTAAGPSLDGLNCLTSRSTATDGLNCLKHFPHFISKGCQLSQCMSNKSLTCLLLYVVSVVLRLLLLGGLTSLVYAPLLWEDSIFSFLLVSLVSQSFSLFSTFIHLFL